MPSSRSPPSGLGIVTRRTGLGRYVPDNSLLADRRPRRTQMRGGLVNVQTVHTGYAFVGPHPFERPLQVLSRQRR